LTSIDSTERWHCAHCGNGFEVVEVIYLLLLLVFLCTLPFWLVYMETYGADFLTPSFVICISKHHHHHQIENRLLDEAERLSTVFLLQDVRCPVTKQVSVKLCASTSDLCAPLIMDISQPELMKQYKVLLRVAEFHGFKWLESTLLDLMT
jgi:hypothetical protein